VNYRVYVDNTVLSSHNIKTEIDRYISRAGQDFDVHEFHYQALKNCSVPLQVFENKINTYIEITLGELAIKQKNNNESLKYHHVDSLQSGLSIHWL